MKTTLKALLTAGIAASFSLGAHAAFMDLSTVDTAIEGGFTGTLDGVSVAGSTSIDNVPSGAPVAGFRFTTTGSTYLTSTLDESSPQYSHASVFGDTTPAADRVGYSMLGGFTAPRVATVTISFGAAISGLVFHIANLDSMEIEFDGIGAGSLSLLNSNGGAGDGLQLLGNVLSDANTSTLIATAPSDVPASSGSRSGYGSVLIDGSFGTSRPLTLLMRKNAAVTSLNRGDGGNFTLSTISAPSSVPEPASAALLLVAATLLACRRLALRPCGGGGVPRLRRQVSPPRSA